MVTAAGLGELCIELARGYHGSLGRSLRRSRLLGNADLSCTGSGGMPQNPTLRDAEVNHRRGQSEFLRAFYHCCVGGPSARVRLAAFCLLSDAGAIDGMNFLQLIFAGENQLQ